MRIVSLLPSATEILCFLGLEDELVGVSHECDFPPAARQLPKVTRSLIPQEASSAEIDRLVRERLAGKGSLYTLELALLEQLQPDIIVTQALCDVCAVAEDEVIAAACQLPGNPRVIRLQPQTLEGVFESILDLARAVGVEDTGEKLVRELRARVEIIAQRSAQVDYRPRVALLEWLDPPFCSGHWNPELVRLAGGIDGLGKEGSPARTVRWEQVLAWQPEVLFIACCGFTIERTLRDLPPWRCIPGWEELPAVRAGRVYVTDGSQYFTRPGPRLVDSLEILAHALHPRVHPQPAALGAALYRWRTLTAAGASRRVAS